MGKYEGRKTIFCDIDGILLRHFGESSNMLEYRENDIPNLLLDGVIEEYNNWRSKGYTVILTSARPETSREFTLKQLAFFGIYPDQLVLGVTNAPRWLINDVSTNKPIAATAINIQRNFGLKGLNL